MASFLKEEVSFFGNEQEVTSYEQNDPSLGKNFIQILKALGHKLVFDREVPIDLRILEPEVLKIVNDVVSAKETLRAKILVLGEESNPSQVRIELFSDNDYFFMYSSQETQTSFPELKQKLQLKVSLPEYPTVIIKMFNNSLKDPQNFSTVFALNSDGSADLIFLQNVEYKTIELLRVQFMCEQDELIRQHVAYRFQLAKIKMTLMNERLKDVTKIVKNKNPSLLTQMTKGATLVKGSQIYAQKIQNTQSVQIAPGRKQSGFSQQSKGASPSGRSQMK